MKKEDVKNALLSSFHALKSAKQVKKEIGQKSKKRKHDEE